MRVRHLFAALLLSPLPAFAAGEKPNIVVILADDMGYGDVGCYNPDSKIPTPHMDRLAADGARFTDAHSASSVCTPSRYALLTGRHCWRTPLKRGVLFNYEPPLIEKRRPTIATLLRDKGYRTGMVGKWHLGLEFSVKAGKRVDFDRPLPWPGGPEPDRAIGESIDFSKPVRGGPNDLGFDRAFFTAGCSTDQEPFCFIDDGVFVDMAGATYRHPAGSWRSGMTAPDWVNETVDVTFTEKAVEFISESQSDAPKKPFFLYLALSAPHSPHLVPGFAKRESAAGVRGDMVWLVDWSVGEITATLDQLGLSENTLLIVTSDNGPLKGSLKPGAPEGPAEISNGHRSAGDLRGYKARIFEGGHRVPFIARWPGKIPKNMANSQPLCLVDLFATFSGILETELPESAAEDSVDRWPALRGERSAKADGKPIVHHSGQGIFALRSGKWKLVVGQPGQKGQLFDMKTDPGETIDRWGKHPDVVKKLTILMEELR